MPLERIRPALLCLAWALLGACASLGGGREARFSCKDPLYFSTVPQAVCSNEDCKLDWTYGSGPSFFFPDYRVKDGKLLFSLGVTTSTGDVAGRHQEMKIEGSENIEALQNGGAFWWEPDGTLLKLKVGK